MYQPGYPDTPSLPNPPTPRNAAESNRWDETRQRRRMLEGTWRDDLERRLQSHLGSVRRDAWGPISLALNAQQYVALDGANGSFYLYESPDGATASPLTGPANGGTAVDVHVPGGGLTAAGGALRALCVFGHAERTTDDAMLLADRMGVAPATAVAG